MTNYEAEKPGKETALDGEVFIASCQRTTSLPATLNAATLLVETQNRVQPPLSSGTTNLQAMVIGLYFTSAPAIPFLVPSTTSSYRRHTCLSD